MLFRSFVCALAFSFGHNLWADAQLASDSKFYYGSFIKQVRSAGLKSELHDILKGFHISQENSFDSIVDFCDVKTNDRCYSHKNLGYKNARKFLFGQLHLEMDQSQEYFIKTAYCQAIIDNSMLSPSKPLGPLLIPQANVLNAEHSWPQSRFSGNFPKSLQKSDLHALYPVRMKVNSTRGNYPFGFVDTIKNKACDQAALGQDSKGQIVFEPSNQVKGNIARSLFYFSTRYRINIDAAQEKYLREWHSLDPVDQQEIDRNQEIFEIQHTRNPYIDHPDWVEQVENF